MLINIAPTKINTVHTNKISQRQHVHLNQGTQKQELWGNLEWLSRKQQQKPQDMNSAANKQSRFMKTVQLFKGQILRIRISSENSQITSSFRNVT